MVVACLVDFEIALVLLLPAVLPQHLPAAQHLLHPVAVEAADFSVVVCSAVAVEFEVELLQPVLRKQFLTTTRTGKSQLPKRN